MAWTDVTLKQAIQDYLETDEATFVANLNTIIVQAEKRILEKVQLPAFRKTTSPSMTGGVPTLPVPADFLSPYSLAVYTSEFEFLVFKQVPFIREVYPNTAAVGVPRYYSLYDDTLFLIGPTPNAGYACELTYFHSPESITVATTSWVGNHAERALLSACLLEGYKFLKGDLDQMKLYEAEMMDALGDLKLLGEGRSRTDEFRSG